jgi:hypothetical protein
VLALSAAPVNADNIYRWVDDNGVVNYTQQKPSGRDAEYITTASGGARAVAEAPTPAPVASTATGAPMNPEQEKMLEGLRAAEQSRQNEIAKLKEENCTKSRDVLARLSLKNRIRIRDENGESRVMPEDERQDRIAKAQEGVALYCVSA